MIKNRLRFVLYLAKGNQPEFGFLPLKTSNHWDLFAMAALNQHYHCFVMVTSWSKHHHKTVLSTTATKPGQCQYLYIRLVPDIDGDIWVWVFRVIPYYLSIEYHENVHDAVLPPTLYTNHYNHNATRSISVFSHQTTSRYWWRYLSLSFEGNPLLLEYRKSWKR
jgi:hypothetical protein